MRIPGWVKRDIRHGRWGDLACSGVRHILRPFLACVLLGSRSSIDHIEIGFCSRGYEVKAYARFDGARQFSWESETFMGNGRTLPGALLDVRRAFRENRAIKHEDRLRRR